MSARARWLCLALLCGCHDFEADFQACRAKGGCGAVGPNGNAKLEFRPPALAFGRRALGVASPPLTAELFNTGTDSSGALTTLTALSGDAGMDFEVTDDQCTGFSVQPDAGCRLQVTFTPRLGPRSATLQVREVGATQPHLLDVDGAGVGVELTASPPSVDFPSVMAGEVAGPQPITVTNTGLLDSAPLALSLTGAAQGFRVDAGSCAQVGLDAGASCSLSVLVIGPDGGGPLLSGELRVTAAQAAVAVPLNGVVYRPGQLSFTPRSIDAGNIELGSGRTFAFTLTNGGIAHSGALTLSLASDGGVFGFDGGTCTAAGLAGTMSCQVNVSIEPAGAQSYSTTLLASSADGGDGVATLFARGVDLVPLSVSVTGAVGSDHVLAASSDGRSLDCPAAACSTSVQRGSVVNLTAAPAAGRTFAGWSGSCSGFDASCRLVPATDAGATAAAAFAAAGMLSVTVSGPGVVVSDPPRISCPPTCSATFPQGVAVKLDPPVTGAVVLGPLTAFTGCDVTAPPHCEVTLSAASRTVNATFTRANVAFLLSTPVSPALGGTAPYDALCRSAALDGGFATGTDAGQWLAWLSTPGAPAAARLGAARGFVRPDGRLVATGEFAGLHRYAPFVTERFVYRDNASAWTGTLGDGGASASTCAGWSDAGPGLNGAVGQCWDLEESWTDTADIACNTGIGLLLYCVQADSTAGVPLPTRHPGMRFAFASRGTAPGYAGLGAFDALCVGEAADAGLPGAFRALLPDIGQSALARFRADGGLWVRVDGLPFAADLATFSAGGNTLTDIHLDATGQPVTGSAFIGTDAPAAAGTPNFTCSGWSSDGGFPRSDLIGTGSTLWGAGSARCGQAAHVYCFQD